jgi:uncharacterized membrane protein YadS
VLLWLIAFALMAPCGIWFYSFYLEQFQPENTLVLSGMVNALLVGILLHVSTTILFESTDGHQFNLLKFVSVILGFLLSAFFI